MDIKLNSIVQKTHHKEEKRVAGMSNINSVDYLIKKEYFIPSSPSSHNYLFNIDPRSLM